jgi:two-component system chemotaxis response regulator CheB
MPSHDIIVIGASAGGVETLKALVRGLPADLPAAVFVVVHVAPRGPGYLSGILAKAGPLPASFPEDGEAIANGHIYVAPPDRHLLLEPGRVRVVRGPKENRHRPAVDPLFRSAAWAYGPRVIGVVLSGTLDDGTAGLWAVKSCGGVAVVQDPEDALYDEMPASALASVDADHVAPLEELPLILAELARTPATGARDAAVAEKLKIESEAAMMKRDIKDMSKLGEPSAFTCPACKGALWELEGGVLRYRCHVGHAYSAESLLASQADAVEEALFSAIRAMEEKAAISRRIAERLGRAPAHAAAHETAAREMDGYANVLRRVLGGSSEPVTEE